LPADERRWESVSLGALAVFILLLGVGVLLRWRWTFWLITVAFLAGVLRAPAAVLQLTGILTADAPTWYLVFQSCSGMALVAAASNSATTATARLPSGSAQAELRTRCHVGRSA
jgi:hypothetical protein